MLIPLHTIQFYALQFTLLQLEGAAKLVKQIAILRECESAGFAQVTCAKGTVIKRKERSQWNEDQDGDQKDLYSAPVPSIHTSIIQT